MSSKKVQVLYKDSSEIYAPLSHLYFSSSSKILISRYVDNVSEEILTSFCPQCFTRYFDSDDTSKQYGGKVCTTCSNCPHCQGVMIKASSDEHHLQCSNCQWEYHHHQSEGQSDSDFTTALTYLDHLDKFFNKKSASASSEGPQDKPLVGRRWQLADLERKLDAVEHHRVDDAYTLWCQNNPQAKTYAPKLQPIPTRLVNKRTLRCQQDLDHNRMNLLVLPKSMPLEGDSSQIINKGKWFDKNASACFTLPILTILQLPTPSSPHLVLKLANHTDKRLDCLFHTGSRVADDADCALRSFVMQDADTGVFDVVESLPVALQYARPPTNTNTSTDTTTSSSTSSSSSSSATVCAISLEEYEDDLLKEDFTPRDRSQYFPSIPTSTISSNSNGSNNSSNNSGDDQDDGVWRVAIQSNIAYVFVPMPPQQQLSGAYEVRMAYDLCVHDAAGRFCVPVDLTVRVDMH